MTELISGPGTIVSTPLTSATASVDLAQTGEYDFTGYYGSSGANQFPIEFNNSSSATETFDASVEDDFFNTGVFTPGLVFELLVTTADAVVGAKNSWTNFGSYYGTYQLGSTDTHDILSTALAPGNYTFTVIPRGLGEGEVNAHFHFHIATTYVGPLFTPGPDNVDFNNLTFQQETAVTRGSDLYDSGDGNDTIRLPTFTSALDLGGLTGVAFDLARAFNLGNGSDTIYGSDSPAIINLGSGIDTVNLQNNDATLEFPTGAGSPTINFATGVGSSPGTITLSTQVGQDVSASINNFVAGDVIDFYGRPNLTLSAQFGRPGEVDIYDGVSNVASLIFPATFDVNGIEPINDEIGGTEIVIDNSAIAETDPNPAGFAIDWAFLHTGEGKELAPYVPLSGNSGVTIGIGVDLANSSITQSDFTTLFPAYHDNSNLVFLYHALYTDLVGGDAITYLTTNRAEQLEPIGPQSLSISITQSQADALTNKAETDTLSDLITTWNASPLWGSGPIVPISSLPGGGPNGFA